MICLLCWVVYLIPVIALIAFALRGEGDRAGRARFKLVSLLGCLMGLAAFLIAPWVEMGVIGGILAVGQSLLGHGGEQVGLDMSFLGPLGEFLGILTSPPGWMVWLVSLVSANWQFLLLILLPPFLMLLVLIWDAVYVLWDGRAMSAIARYAGWVKLALAIAVLIAFVTQFSAIPNFGLPLSVPGIGAFHGGGVWLTIVALVVLGIGGVIEGVLGGDTFGPGTGRRVEHGRRPTRKPNGGKLGKRPGGGRRKTPSTKPRKRW